MDDTPILTAMVLAAGRGERLRPLTDHLPKPLVPLAGQPMVEQVFALLRRHGVKAVHMNTHHLGEQLPEALGDGSRYGLDITYHAEDAVLGTGGGLLNALRHAPEMAGQPFIMINSDVLCDVDLTAALAQHKATGALATLVLRPDPNAVDYGMISTDDNGRIQRFLAQDRGGATRDYMFTGIQVLSPAFIRYLAPSGPFPITDSYRAALADDAWLYGFEHTGYWADLGTPERLLKAETEWSQRPIEPPSTP